MGRRADDGDDGLIPREWLDHDAVPLTPDVDLDDPEQRRAWIRANLEEMRERRLDLERRRGRRRNRGDRDDVADPDDPDDVGGPGGPAGRRTSGPGSSTTVVAVRVLNAEHRALVRLARREAVTVSDLVRRWVRSGLAAGWDVDPVVTEPDERARTREAVAAAADATVERITDELRRWRELVADAG